MTRRQPVLEGPGRSERARARWRERETEDGENNKYFSFVGCIYVSVPGDPGGRGA